MSRTVKLDRQGDDIDRPKRALFDADTTPNTEFFRDLCFVIIIDDDRLVTCPDARTIDDTLLPTLL